MIGSGRVVDRPADPGVAARISVATGAFAVTGMFVRELNEKRRLVMQHLVELKEQMLPAKFREFETFLSSAGIDPNTQVTELAWALVPSKSSTDNASGSVPTMDQIVGVALGRLTGGPIRHHLDHHPPPTV